MLTPGKRDRIAMGNAESSTTVATLSESARNFSQVVGLPDRGAALHRDRRMRRP
jgi:hypothetical protein